MFTQLIKLASTLLFRIRGGLFPTGSTTAARLIYGFGLSTAMTIALVDWRLFFMGVPLFVGAIFPMFNGIDMGRNEGTWSHDAFMMLLRGFLFTGFAAAYLLWLGYAHWWYLLAAGALYPVVYELGWRIPSKIKNFAQGPELGEFFFGIILSLVLTQGLL